MSEYKILIALGKALELEDNKAILTPSSKATAYATGVIGDRGDLNQLIISGGKTLGLKYASEAELMRDFIYKNISRDVADFATLEDKSKTTLGNVKNIVEILEENINQDIGLLTVEYHLNRATRTFKRKGFSDLISLASEDFLGGDYKGRFLDYLNSPKGKGEEKKEKIISLVTFFPGGTELLEFIATNFTRGD